MERRAASALLVIALFGLSALAWTTSHPAVGGLDSRVAGHPAGSTGAVSAFRAGWMPIPSMPHLAPALIPAETIIWPNGTLGGAAAPINVSGNVYTLTANFTGGLIVERNGSTLNGAGHQLGADPTVYDALELTGVSGATVENISVANGSVAILVQNSQDVSIAHNWVSALYDGVAVLTSGNVSVSNNSADNTDSGFYFFHDSGVTVRDNTAWNSAYEGILFQSSTDGTIAQNQVNNSNTGIFVEYSTGFSVLSNNASFEASSGIEAYQSSHGILSGNNVNVSYYGMDIEYASFVTSDHNVGDATGYSGIFLYQSQEVSFSHEQFGQAVYYGIYVEYSGSVTVANSVFSGAGEEGVYGYSVGPIMVTGNNASGYFYEGVYLDVVRDALISGNTLQNPAYLFGVAIYVYQGTNVTVSDNTAPQAPYGLEAYTCSQLNVSGNDFSHAMGSNEAIYVSNSRNVWITQNNVFNASRFGIQAYANVGLWIQDNNVSAAGVSAVYVQDSTSVSILDNTADHAAFDSFYLYGDTGLVVRGNTAGQTTDPGGAGVAAYYLTGALIEGNTISNTSIGLNVVDDSGSQFVGNNVSHSTNGLLAFDDANTVFSGNSFWADTNGFSVTSNQQIWIYHNSFVNDSGWVNGSSIQLIHWDNGYPAGGNFWSNHSGPDAQGGAGQNVAGADGIVDTPMVINASNIDHYPLAVPFKMAFLDFVETGLDAGESWTVTVAGTPLSSTTSSIWFPMENGASSSYPYQVSAVAGYLPPSPVSGTASSSRTNQTINVVFSEQKFNLTFHESGLKNGTSWSVTVDGVSTSSSTTSIVVAVQNGTHAFAVEATPTGFRLVAGGLNSGNVTVAGASRDLGTATFVVWPQPTPTPGGGTTNTNSNGYTNTQFFGVLGLAILLGIMAAIGFALWMGSRKAKPPAAAAAWTPPPATPAPPPTSSSGGSPPSGQSPPPGAM